MYQYKLVHEDGTEREFQTSIFISDLTLKIDEDTLDMFVYFKDIDENIDFTNVKEVWIDGKQMPHFVTKPTR